jgi:hypothetical protein
MSLIPTLKTPPITLLSNQRILFYGREKIGKSTFWAQAEGALFLDMEGGLNSLCVARVPSSKYEETLAALAEFTTVDHGYKTLVVDGVEALVKQCSEFVLKKYNVDHESDLPYGKGHTLVGNEVGRVLRKLALSRYGLVLIAHQKAFEIETRTGKYTRVGPSLPEKIQNLILAFVDLILYCDLEYDRTDSEEPQIRRVIRTKPSPYYEAGDRTGRLPETLPLDYSAFLHAFNGGAARPATK